MAMVIKRARADGDYLYLHAESTDTPGLAQDRVIHFGLIMSARKPAEVLAAEINMAMTEASMEPSND